MTITVDHRVERDDLGLGLVRVEQISTGPAPAALAAELDRWIVRRADTELSEAEEALRKGSRDVLRNGKYKPTGRGKPASEYLLRAARQGDFPRINGPVDANNLVSLRHCAPISVWDLDLAGSRRFEFRLGQADESYVFNSAGQQLDLCDLVCGCVLDPEQGPGSRAVVTPIKDSMATKTRAETSRLAGCVYYPLRVGGAEGLDAATDELLRWLLACGPQASGASAVALPGQRVEL